MRCGTTESMCDDRVMPGACSGSIADEPGVCQGDPLRPIGIGNAIALFSEDWYFCAIGWSRRIGYWQMVAAHFSAALALL